MFLSNWSKRFRRRAWKTKTPATQLIQATVGTSELRKCLGPLDLIMLGIGGIIGSGVFVLTGVASRQHAGPAVVLSYSVAAGSALLSGLCYTEFVVDLPAAGGAFNYISVVFGEFIAWVVACNMILEYTLSAAAVARGFSAYLATLAGLQPTFFIVNVGALPLDFFALGLIVLLSCILAYGTKESARFNMAVTMVNLAVVVFVVCAGLPYASGANFKPFAPYGATGVFAAASIVFFSFIGFDTVATTAEEVRNPPVDMPIGIMGSLLVCGFLYALMCVVISLMLPYQQIDINAPFSQAFGHILTTSNKPGVAKRVFLHFAQRLVSIGALTGIVTSLLVGLMGQARIYVVLGREWLLPSWFSTIHKHRQTPMNAAAFTCLTAGTLALLVDISTLAQLVSIGTLFVFYMVDLGVLVRRYCQPGTSLAEQRPFVIRVVAMLILNIGFTLSFRLGAPVPVYAIFAALWLVAALTLCTLPVVWRAKEFSVPLSPLTPALGMFVTVHLIGSLGWKSYARFGVWVVISVTVYLLYSMQRADAKELADDQRAVAQLGAPGLDGRAEAVSEVELMNPNPAHTPLTPPGLDSTDDVWRDDASSDDDDNDRRGTSGLLKNKLSSHDPSFYLPTNDASPPPPLPVSDLPPEVPGSTVGWAAVHDERSRHMQPNGSGGGDGSGSDTDRDLHDTLTRQPTGRRQR